MKGAVIIKSNTDTRPKVIFEEYKKGTEFKASIGNKGIFEQSKINGRFYIGDHWYGAKCGNDRPLVRRNIIRRIADYKLSSIGAAPVAVNFSAEGIPDNVIGDDERKESYEGIISGQSDFGGEVDNIEISTVMRLLSEYSATAMERMRFNELCYDLLKNAYISGTGILYTYWDELINTGLYADEGKNTPIMGDIISEVVDIENVIFGDPNNSEVQSQPYIIISQRKECSDVKREAKRNKISENEIEKIIPDRADYLYFNAGTRGEDEPNDSARVTVLTKFYKEWDEEGKSFKVFCVRCTERATVKKAFDIGIRLYPISKLVWDKRRSSAYGDSEITYLIPNQIAVNRSLSAEVWGTMLTGMPIMLVNGEVIEKPITNDPGQIIKVYSGENDIQGAVRYVNPPAFAGQMLSSINDLASNTLSDSGANDAALGNMNPDNATAIIQLREAARQPLQIKQNQYYAFIEDTARIWAEFWVKLYGDRKLKINTAGGVAYVPFYSKRYEKLLISARVDVGAASLWSTAVVVSALDSLLTNQIITPEQYLERMPDGIIPDKTGLINEIKEARAQNMQAQTELSDDAVISQFAAEQPQLYEKFKMLPPERQRALLDNMRQNSGGQADDGGQYTYGGA